MINRNLHVRNIKQHDSKLLSRTNSEDLDQFATFIAVWLVFSLLATNGILNMMHFFMVEHFG